MQHFKSRTSKKKMLNLQNRLSVTSFRTQKEGKEKKEKKKKEEKRNLGRFYKFFFDCFVFSFLCPMLTSFANLE